jgi:hypothetical protein
MNIQELCDRYSLKNRQSIYEWTRALEIKFPKDESNKSYATPDQIDLLDQLSEHLKAGNSIKSFSPLVKTTVSPSPDTVSFPLDTFTEPSHNSDLVDLVNAIASIIKPNPGLSRHEELEKAAVNGWILSTSELNSIGFKVSCKNGSRFCDRGCWRFTKSGKIGHESAWSVQKITKG